MTVIVPMDVLQLSGRLAGDVKESPNGNPTRDLQMAADRIRPHTLCGPVVVWSKISNALKRLGFQSHNFLTQLLSEISRACTIRVRRSTLGRLWNELGSHAGLHHRHRRSRTAGAERIPGCGEPYPESPDQGPTAPFRS